MYYLNWQKKSAGALFVTLFNFSSASDCWKLLVVQTTHPYDSSVLSRHDVTACASIADGTNCVGKCCTGKHSCQQHCSHNYINFHFCVPFLSKIHTLNHSIINLEPFLIKVKYLPLHFTILFIIKKLE